MNHKEQEWADLKSKLIAIAENPAPTGHKYDPNTDEFVKLVPNKPRSFYEGTIATRPTEKLASGEDRYAGYYRDLVFIHFEFGDSGLVETIYYRQKTQPQDRNPNAYFIREKIAGPGAIRATVPIKDMQIITDYVLTGRLATDTIYKTYWCRDFMIYPTTGKELNIQRFLNFKLHKNQIVD